MGKTWMGGSTHEGNIDLLTPQQQSYLSQGLNPQNAQAAGQAYNQFLQPYNPEMFGELFQKSFVDPAQQQLQRNIIPTIKESFMGMDESGSGALNRALAQSATDVGTNLGSQYMNLYNQQAAQRMNALQQLGGMAGQKTFAPHLSQQQGLAGPLIQALGSIVGGSLGGGGSVGVGALTSMLSKLLGGGG